MIELVYGPIDTQDLILKEYSRAKFKDASGCVHEERFEVEIENIDEKDFWKFALRNGFADACFGLRLWSIKKPKEFLEFVDKPREKLNGHE